MQNDETFICDYHFAQGHRAQYIYIDAYETEQAIIVIVLEHTYIKHEKVYIVSAQETLLEKAGVVFDEQLTEQYYTSLPNNHKVAYLDPDELIPAFRQLELIVDNTK